MPELPFAFILLKPRPVLLEMEANQATLIDGWDRKEEPLIAFAAAFFRSIYKGLDGTVLLSVPTAVAREVYSSIAGATFFLRVGAHHFLLLLYQRNPPTILIWRFIHSKLHSFKKNSFISMHCALLLLPTRNRIHLHLFSLAVMPVSFLL